MSLALKKQLLVVALLLFIVFSDVKSRPHELLNLSQKTSQHRGLRTGVPFWKMCRPVSCATTTTTRLCSGIALQGERRRIRSARRRVERLGMWVSHCLFEGRNFPSRFLMPLFPFRTALLVKVTRAPVASLWLSLHIWFHISYFLLKST